MPLRATLLVPLVFGLIPFAALSGPAMVEHWREVRDLRERIAHERTHMNGVHIGDGQARMRVLARTPATDGEEIWIDEVVSVRVCAGMTAAEADEGGPHYIRVRCLDPESHAPLPNLTRARLWPDADV